MLKKLNLIWTLTVVFLLSACAGDSGERIPIKRSSDKSSSKSKLTGITAKSGDGKKTCLNIKEVVKKITNLKQSSFRTYISDLRILESNNLNIQNLQPLQDKELQKQFLKNMLAESADSFYLVDYAKNIIKDAPSTLAPFSISEQKNCDAVSAKFFDDSEVKSFKIVQDSMTDFFLHLQSDDTKENYSFQLVNQNQINFTSLQATQLEVENTGQKSKKDFIARTVSTYEWEYSQEKALILSYQLANTFKEILTKKTSVNGQPDKESIEVPTEVLEALSKATASDTAKVRISAEDLMRIRQDSLK